MTTPELPSTIPQIRYVSGVPTTVSTPVPTPLGPHDILLRLTHSGVCHTDLIFAQLGSPTLLGHEGVGVVAAVGAAVTTLAPGDVAGVGFQRWHCGTCAACARGHTTACARRQLYAVDDTDHGTFAPWYVAHETQTYRVPAGLAPELAAPLQCAGATVYAALVDTARPGHRVGVLGIGGLGHLAVQFAAKMGCEVVVFSSSKAKEEEARGFGAGEFVLLAEAESVSKPVDVLLLTGAGNQDWNMLMNPKILARDGVVVPLSAPATDYTLPSLRMFWERYHVHSSLVADRNQHQDMLEFAARNGIKPIVELYPHEGPETVEKIFDKLKKGTVRYRAVLVM